MLFGKYLFWWNRGLLRSGPSWVIWDVCVVIWFILTFGYSIEFDFFCIMSVINLPFLRGDLLEKILVEKALNITNGNQICNKEKSKFYLKSIVLSIFDCKSLFKVSRYSIRRYVSVNLINIPRISWCIERLFFVCFGTRLWFAISANCLNLCNKCIEHE